MSEIDLNAPLNEVTPSSSLNDILPSNNKNTEESSNADEDILAAMTSKPTAKELLIHLLCKLLDVSSDTRILEKLATALPKLTGPVPHPQVTSFFLK